MDMELIAILLITLFNALVCVCLPKMLMLLSSGISNQRQRFSNQAQEAPSELSQHSVAL